MTVVNPKSISGINSITTGSGSDDLLTIHTNNGTERLRVDSTGATKIVTGIVTTLTATTGIVTSLEATTGDITTLRAPTGIVTSLEATTGDITTLRAPTGIVTSLEATTGDITTLRAPTGIVTTFVTNTAKVGAAVTITESGIEASGIGITCANINGSQIGGRRNLVINGAQLIDQRNAGNAVTPSQNTSTFITDRFMVFESTDGVVSAQQSSTAPDGFRSSLKIDCTTADTSLAAGQRLICEHRIEGNNIVHLGFGSSAAKNVTLSFYVRSNLTGTFGGVIKNSANNRTYIFSYSISSANTWERKSITIPGDTTGTWLTTNGTGIIINWGLALGSNWTGTAGSYVTSDKHGVTGQLNLLSSTDNEWLLTGVQLEVGDQATAFEHLSFAEERLLCKRYYHQLPATDTQGSVGGYLFLSKPAYYESESYYFPVEMRAAPTMTTGGTWILRAYGSGSNTSATATINSRIERFYVTSSASNTNESYVWILGADSNYPLKIDAEL